MDVFGKLLCVVVFLGIVTRTVYTQDVCVKKSSCSCEFSNGTGYDYSASSKPTFYTMQYFQELDNAAKPKFVLDTYYYHPCGDALPPVNATDNLNNTCGKPLSICRHRKEMTLQPNTNNTTYKIDSERYEFLGSAYVTNFSSDGRSIVYYNGPSSTVVLHICSEADDNLQMYSVEDPSKIVMAFYSPIACLKTLEAPGRSLGSTLLIVLFSMIIFYLVLGICTKKFLMGATGVEVIPNLTFWTDLPNLVRDGWAFALNGFKLPPRGAGPATSPDPNSYDSI